MGALLTRRQFGETAPDKQKLRAKYAHKWPEYADDWCDLPPGAKVTVSDDMSDDVQVQRFLNKAWQKQVAQLAGVVFQSKVHHLDFQDTRGRSALHLVSLNGSDMCASILLDQTNMHPINVNLVDHLGRSALMYAVFRGRVGIIKRLLEKNADSNLQDFRGLNALMIAASAPYLYYIDLVTQEDLVLRQKDLRDKLVSSKLLSSGTWSVLKDTVSAKNARAVARKTSRRLSATAQKIYRRNDIRGRNSNNYCVNTVEPCSIRYPHLTATNSIGVRVLDALLDFPGKDPILIDAPDTRGMSALSWACKYGHTTAVSRLLVAKASLEHQDSAQLTPFLHAVQGEHHNVMEFLIECSADVNAANMYLESGLHMAINNGDDQGWEILLKQSADIEAQDHCGQTPILLALKKKKRILFERLIEMGASLDVVNTKGWNVIIQAIHSGLGTSLNKVFKRTPDEELRKSILRWADPQGRTALHHAISPKLVNDAKFILSIDEHVTIADCNGMTPVHLAAECNAVEIMNAICRCASDLDIPNNWGETPLHAAANSGSLACALCLLSIKKNLYPADCTRTDNQGRTVLMHACTGGNLDLVKLLLLNKEGFNRDLGFVDPCINAQDNNGLTALMYASINGHWEIISALVLGMADITLVDKDGFNALHHAASEGENYCCMTLADLGVPNYMDNRGNTPLHCAVEKREVQVCQTLLDRTADVHARNHDEETPLGIALSTQCLEISEVLCKHIQEMTLTHEAIKGAKVTALGKFMVTIKECKGLFIGDLDTTNPYAMIQFKLTELSETAMATTSCILGNKSQLTWHETFEFDSEYIDQSASLVITVLRMPEDDTHSLLNKKEDTEVASALPPSTMFGQIIAKQTREQEMQKLVKKDELIYQEKNKVDSRNADRAEQAWGIFNLAKGKLCFPVLSVPKSHVPFGFANVKSPQLRAAVQSSEPRQFDLPLRGSAIGGRVTFEIDFRPRLWKCVDVANRSLLERRLHTPRSEDVDETF